MAIGTLGGVDEFPRSSCLCGIAIVVVIILLLIAMGIVF